jgi:hypothetical protein
LFMYVWCPWGRQAVVENLLPSIYMHALVVHAFIHAK